MRGWVLKAYTNIQFMEPGYVNRSCLEKSCEVSIFLGQQMSVYGG